MIKVTGVDRERAVTEKERLEMFQFTEDCILGLDEIDEEHRRLFDLLGQGMDMLKNRYIWDRYEDIKDLLRQLEDYAEQHFAHEEAYMEQIRDPELILQRSQHMAFREKICNFGLTDIDEPQVQQELLEELISYLAKWLYHHIIGSDILIGKLPPLEEWMVRENPCEFTEEYQVGISLIDKEHEMLFEIIGRANRLVREGVDEDSLHEIWEILKELKTYTQFHFKDEEEYMERMAYEGLPAQKRAHTAFIGKIESIDLVEVGQNPQEYMQSLMEFLLGWLINHILNSDKKIPKEL